MNMIDKLSAEINAAYPLEEKNDSTRSFKASGLKFNARSFTVNGFGHMSIMTATGFFGLMKMETLILNPFFIDAPILSYDRIHAMGREILVLEMYDSLLGNSFPAAGLEAVARDCPNMKKDKTYWYDSLLIPPNLNLKGKRKDKAAFDETAAEFFRAYFAAAQQAEPCDPGQKRMKAAVYSEGLLTHGGPATDPVRKAMGETWTADLFRVTLFGTAL